MIGARTRADAERFISDSDFIWHQAFPLAEGIFTPGANQLEYLFEVAGVSADLSGRTVLDIGTSNGGAAFECERRGADRVVAVDIYPPSWFGFEKTKEFLRSDAQYVQASIYGLPELLPERFDLVLFWGVLYHLRHPLLALDGLRRMIQGEASIETAVADYELGELGTQSIARFYRRDELSGDPSNWFVPTTTALTDWCWSAGLEPFDIQSWPEESPSRAMVRVKRVEGEPEYLAVSYERPLSVTGELTVEPT